LVRARLLRALPRRDRPLPRSRAHRRSHRRLPRQALRLRAPFQG